jgi:5-methyltetrahydrofolate--homocysteine methyltransferase
MPIDFTPDRWNKVKETYRRWWANELERPVVELILHGRDPGRPEPKAPLLTQETCADLSIPADALIDRLDYELSKQVFLGDSFPMVSMEMFGPGVGAAMMGARLDNSTGRVWFHPAKDMPIEDIHFSYDPNNVWLRRIKEICAAAMDRWQGQVLVGMTDLGGNLDTLSTFRPSEELLMDLIDSPDEVKRLTWKAHDLWHRFYAEIDAVLQPVNPGYSAWCRIFSNEPFYILQSDFSYMISPEMFREFVLDELDASSRKLPNCFYHLDGRGQLPHLDMVLAMEKVEGVQWVPGDGALPQDQWMDVYRRIFAAGKKTQLITGFEGVHKIMCEAGLGGGIHCWMPRAAVSEEKRMQKHLAGLGIED